MIVRSLLGRFCSNSLGIRVESKQVRKEDAEVYFEIISIKKTHTCASSMRSYPDYNDPALCTTKRHYGSHHSLTFIKKSLEIRSRTIQIPWSSRNMQFILVML